MTPESPLWIAATGQKQPVANGGFRVGYASSEDYSRPNEQTMPSFTISRQGKPLARVNTDRLELLSIHVSGTRISDEFACIETHGGVYSGEGEQKHLIWINSEPLQPGETVKVDFSMEGETSHPGRSIEELYPDEPSEGRSDFKSGEDSFGEVRERAQVRGCHRFEVQLPSGEIRQFESLPEEHGFGFLIVWHSSEPERARMSLNTYTLEGLERREAGNDHVRQSLVPGTTVAIRVDGSLLH